MRTSFYLEKDTDKMGRSPIYLQACFDGKKFKFCFLKSIIRSKWDKVLQRVVIDSETIESGDAEINNLLDKIENECHKLYLSLSAICSPDVEKIKSRLKLVVVQANGINKVNRMNYSLNYSNEIKKNLSISYLKQLARQRGFSGKQIKENPEILLTLKEITKIKRLCQSQTLNN